MRRGWWIIAAVVAAVSCGTSGGGKSEPGQDAGPGMDGGTVADGGTDGGGDGGPGTDGGTDGGVTPDGGGPDGGNGAFTTITWTKVADRPLGTSEAHGIVVAGKLYTFGGFNWGNVACCTPWRFAFVYDPASDSWAPLADMPEGVTHAGVSTDGTDVFYAGGFIEDASRTYQIFGTKHVWRYRVASDSYEPMPDLPVERGAGALQYLDGKLHFFGGLSFGQASDTPEHWVLDLAGGGTSWVPAAPMLPGRARNHLGSVVLAGKIYAVGGQHGHDEGLTTTSNLDVYDPATDAWTQLADMPLAKSHVSGATFVFQGRILTLAGETANGVFTDEVAAYDPVTNSWKELTPFPERIYSGIAGPVAGGFVYTTGGFSQRTWLGVPAD